MNSILLVVYTIVCLLIVVLVLVNQNKSAGAGAAFGGASQTVFGSRGHMGFITKMIIGLAVLFFVIAMLISIFSQDFQSEISNELQPALDAQQQELPVLPGEGTGNGDVQLPDFGQDQ